MLLGGYELWILGLLLSLGAAWQVRHTMRKFAAVRNASGRTGGEVARSILDREGLRGVGVECLSGEGGDHYDPRTKTVRLSSSNYRGASVTALSVAAHECGHAIQDAQAFAPLRLRTSFVPVANLAAASVSPLLMLGIIMQWNTVLIQLAILAFAVSVLFHLITLPVEVDASRRALAILDQYGMWTVDEARGGRKVLTAAAMTYVAAALASLLELLRLLLIFGRRDND